MTDTRVGSVERRKWRAKVTEIHPSAKFQDRLLELRAERAHRAELSPTERPSSAFKLLRADEAGQPSAKQLETSNSPAFVGSVETNSTVTVVGKIKDQVTTRLVDTGSAVTVVRADLWESITGGHLIELKPPEQPVVVADG